MSTLKNAYMPFYIGDYRRKTQHLNATQHGAYLNILFHYWDNGKIEDNDDFLFKISACERKSVWLKIRPVIAKFFVLESGFWFHKRADYERKKLEETRQKLSDAGKKSQENRVKKPSENNQDFEQKNALPVSQPIDFKRNTSSQAEPRLQQSTPTSVSTTFINNTTSITPAPTSYLKDAGAENKDFDFEKFKEVGEKVLNLCGNSPNLHYSRVRTWLEADCDPELDIYPAIKLAMNKKHGIPPNSLSYFDKPVMCARENRLKPLPTFFSKQSKQSDRDDYLEKLKADIEREKSHAA